MVPFEQKKKKNEISVVMEVFESEEACELFGIQLL